MKQATAMVQLLQTGDIDEITSTDPKQHPKLDNNEPL